MRTVTWAWEMRSTWWAWLASRPPPSRCDTLSGSPSHTPDHTPGPAPGDTPPAAPAPPPDTRGAGPGRRQDTQLGVIIMISWQSWHCSAIICKQLRCPVITALDGAGPWAWIWYHWPGRLLVPSSADWAFYFEHSHQTVTGNCWHVQAWLMYTEWLDPVQRIIGHAEMWHSYVYWDVFYK